MHIYGHIANTRSFWERYTEDADIRTDMSFQGIQRMALLLLFFFASAANAEERYFTNAHIDEHDTYYTHATWNSAEHPRIREMVIAENGTAYGTTTSGVPFTQYLVSDESDLRIQRFEIEGYYHYIVEGHVVQTQKELSILLSQLRAHHE